MSALAPVEVVDCWHEHADVTVSGEWLAPGIRHPHTLIAHAEGSGAIAVRVGRLRRAEQGPVSLRRRFWNDDVLEFAGRAPRLPIAADLLTSPEERLQEQGQNLLDSLEGESVRRDEILPPLSLLSDLYEALGEYMLIGSYARDHICSFEARPEPDRSTEDVDVAVVVSAPAELEAVFAEGLRGDTAP